MSPLIQELEDIIDNEKDVIPFLKKLSNADKKTIKPKLKSLIDKIEYPHNRNKKVNTIIKASFVCFNKKEFEETEDHLWNLDTKITTQDFFENILSWYVPKWYNTIVNEAVNDNKSRFYNYHDLLHLEQNGLVKLSKALVVETLPNFYGLEDFEKYPITLSEHIWCFFDIPSSVYIESHKWISTFIELSNSNKIDRIKLLKEALQALSKNFDSHLSHWFIELFSALEPSNKELLFFQDELLSTLHSSNTKVLRSLQNHLKSIIPEDSFKVNNFIENCIGVLNSKTKSVVNLALSTLELLFKYHPNSSQNTCEIITEVLLNKDFKLQEKAAKLIKKHGILENKTLIQLCTEYSDTCSKEVKEILKDFVKITDDNQLPENIEYQTVELLSKDNEIPTHKTFDELIFFISQALDENTVYDKEILLSRLNFIQPHLTVENITFLEPIYKRVISLIAKTGYTSYDHVLYFKDVLECLASKFSTAKEKFKKIKAPKIKSIEKEILRYRHYNDDGSERYSTSGVHAQQTKHLIEQQFTFFEISKSSIYYHLINTSKSIFDKKLNIELLSSPTHKPFWIDPKTLIKRIVDFENAGLNINIYDFQIAMDRIPLHQEYPNIKQLIEQINNKEVQAVFNYHFDFISIENCNVQKPELWISSVISKNIESDIEFYKRAFKTTLHKEMGVMYYYYFFEIELDERKDFDSVYHLEWFYSEAFLPNQIYTVPNELLFDVWYRRNYNNASYKTFAETFMVQEKAHRDIAAEVWLKNTSIQTMDNALLGDILGRIVSRYSLSRFLDVVTNHLFNISKTHNKALLEVFNNMIVQIEDIPIKNSKKLLELYAELLQLQNAEIPNAVKERLTVWNETKSLKAVIKKLV